MPNRKLEPGLSLGDIEDLADEGVIKVHDGPPSVVQLCHDACVELLGSLRGFEDRGAFGDGSWTREIEALKAAIRTWSSWSRGGGRLNEAVLLDHARVLLELLPRAGSPAFARALRNWTRALEESTPSDDEATRKGE